MAECTGDIPMPSAQDMGAPQKITLIVADMCRCPADEEMQLVYVEQLCTLAFDAGSLPATAEAHTVYALLSALSRHSCSNEIRVWACLALRVFSEHQIPTHRQSYCSAMYAAGAVPLVLQAMCYGENDVQHVLRAARSNKKDFMLQGYGCEIVANLTENPEHRTSIALAGAIQVVLTAMVCNLDLSQVQIHGCRMLLNMCRTSSGDRDDAIVAVIVQADGISLVQSALEHTFHERVSDAMTQIIFDLHDVLTNTATPGYPEWASVLRARKRSTQQDRDRRERDRDAARKARAAMLPGKGPGRGRGSTHA
jgi:hypothetical protein